MAKRSKVKKSRRGRKRHSINWSKVPNLPGAKKKKGPAGGGDADKTPEAGSGPKGESSRASGEIGRIVKAMTRAESRDQLRDLTRKANSLVNKMKRPQSQKNKKSKINQARKAIETAAKSAGSFKKMHQKNANSAAAAGVFIPQGSKRHRRLVNRVSKLAGQSKKKGR